MDASIDIVRRIIPATETHFVVPDSFPFMGFHLVYLVGGNPTLTPWPPNLPVQFLRQPGFVATINWQDIETPTKGTFTWTTFDSYITQLKAHGTKLVYGFNGCPSWARADHNTTLLPDNTTDATDFITTLLNRAASVAPGVIDVIEIWNEMNGVATAAVSAAFGTAVYNAVKAVNPSIMVISPSIGSGFNAASTQWVRDYYANNGPGQALNWHGYSDRPEEDYPFRYNAMASIGAAAGLPQPMPNWNTETSKSFAAVGNYDQTLVAQSVAKNFLVCYGLGVGRVYWYLYEQRFGGTSPDLATTGFWDYITFLNQLADTTYGEIYKWLFGAAVVSPIQRQAGTNAVSNPTFAGAIVGTPGTQPTDATMSADSLGITQSVVAVGSGTITLGFTGTATGDKTYQWRMNRPADTAVRIAASNGQTWTQTFHLQVVAGSLTGITFAVEMQIFDAGGNFLADVIAPDIFITTADQFITITGTINNASVAFIAPTIDIFIANTTNLGAGLQVKLSSLTMDNSTLWTGTFTRPGGYRAQATWDMIGNATYAVPATYTQYRDIYGNKTLGVSGNITIGVSPLLLENQSAF